MSWFFGIGAGALTKTQVDVKEQTIELSRFVIEVKPNLKPNQIKGLKAELVAFDEEGNRYTFQHLYHDLEEGGWMPVETNILCTTINQESKMNPDETPVQTPETQPETPAEPTADTAAEQPAEQTQE